MRTTFVSVAALVVAVVTNVAQAATCTSNLLVDDFSKFSTNTNSLGQYTADDGTTTNLKSDTANKKITFTAKSSSYFYETFNCQAATTGGYNAFTFPIKGPSGGSFTLELQTKTTCSATKYTSYYYSVPTKMTGSTITVTVPLSSWSGANLNMINSLLFESMTAGAWEIGSIQLVCANSGTAAVSSTTSSSKSISSSIILAVSSSTSTLKTSTSTSLNVPTTSSVKPSTSTTTTSFNVPTTSSVKPSTSTTTTSSISSTSTTTFSTSTSKSTTSAASSTTSTSTSSSTKSSTSSKSTTSSAATGTCTNLLIDDFASQSRLTFLFYNSLLQPSSDDGTMKAVANRPDTGTSVIVANNHVTLTPVNAQSYWYTMFGCLKATNVYSGIAFTISAPAGVVITVEMQTDKGCSTANPTLIDLTSKDLGWVFDGTEKTYSIPFSKFSGLDTDHLISVLFSGFTKAITFGPMSFYCGTPSVYPVPSTAAVIEPSSTVPATVGPSAFVIDTFTNADSNNLGFYHGGDDTTTYKQANGKLTINTSGNSDLSWYTQLSGGCSDYTANDNGYLHIVLTGSTAFTIALQQHNPTCNPDINPYPYTWDSVEASRYSNSAKTEIYVPISHFNIDRTKTIGIALKGFYTSTASVFSKIELVKTVPADFLVPSKLPTAPLIFSCTRPNSFAFAIDDGDPTMAQQVIKSVQAAGIHVTFFTVGAALVDQTTNLTNVYKEMLSLGHQVAYHSYTHPPMEGLPSLAAIDWELNSDIAAVSSQLGITSTYFRPPFGTEGSRIRQRLAALIPGSKFVEWSVDCQDWLWALSTTPEKQLTNFQADVNKGGNLVVMHYLYPTTVQYIPQFIAIAQKTGKQIMRLDQCLEDPNAPPL